MKILLIICSVLTSSKCFSGNLFDNAEISKVASSSNGYSDDFHLSFSSGTGPCSGQNWVIFPRNLAPSDGAFSRMYSTALAAFSTGKKVRVFAAGSDDCRKATFIEILK